MGNLADARKAFAKAVDLHPQSAAAYNNLAQVLADQGQLAEALEAARHAVAIGGPMSAVYQSTLTEIQSKKRK
jgi:Flp pilus assembly protein TadD